MMLSNSKIVDEIHDIIREHYETGSDGMARLAALSDAISSGTDLANELPLDYCPHCKVPMMINGDGYECPKCQAYYN